MTPSDMNSTVTLTDERASLLQLQGQMQQLMLNQQEQIQHQQRSIHNQEQEPQNHYTFVKLQIMWVCLFTCLVTRAVHLELLEDMSTERFLMGLRRFIACRGSPYEIISDNAGQFKLASGTIDKLWTQIWTDKDVMSYASSKNIKWKFTIELAPWMGGFYERLVGLVKRSLRKAIGKLCLTIIKESEAIINSRPLVYVDDDINSDLVLTPLHFLSLNPKTGIPNVVSDDEADCDFNPKISSADSLLHIWKKGLKHLKAFWRVWRDSYLLSLRERTQMKLKTPRIQASVAARVGHVVLIKDDMPRGCWRVGKIAELIRSIDGNIRSPKIRLPTRKLISRPLNLLYPIECSGEEQSYQNDEQISNDSDDVTKYGPGKK